MRKCGYGKQAKNSPELETVYYYDLISMKATQIGQDKCTGHIVGGQADLLSLVLSVIYSVDGYFSRLSVFREFRGIVLLHICKNYFPLSTCFVVNDNKLVDKQF